MTEPDLIAEMDQIISDMTGVNGIAPPANWVVAELMRRHSVDLGEHPNAELIMRCATAFCRGIVRVRLGLPWDEDQVTAESSTLEELREEVERRFRHADEFEGYQRERPSIPKE